MWVFVVLSTFVFTFLTFLSLPLKPVILSCPLRFGLITLPVPYPNMSVQSPLVSYYPTFYYVLSFGFTVLRSL